jgi:energy-coupling factor transport system ATP-binding protein
MIGVKILIKLEEIDFSYDNEKIFENFSLKFKKGKFYALLGKNGCGKSTLIKLILGIERIIKGNIYINGLNLKNNIFECRKEIGIVFQNPDEQIVTDIVEEEIAFAMENYGFSSEIMEEKIEELVTEIEFQNKKTEKISNLSGGEKQRLCIASALVLNPKVLILDEATSMLDSLNRKKIMDLLKKLNSKGITIILITHHLTEIENCDYIYYLDKNQVKFSGDKNLFKSLIVKGELQLDLELPPMFKVAKNIYSKTKIDVSEDTCNLEKMGEYLWKSL